MIFHYTILCKGEFGMLAGKMGLASIKSNFSHVIFR